MLARITVSTVTWPISPSAPFWLCSRTVGCVDATRIKRAIASIKLSISLESVSLRFHWLPLQQNKITRIGVLDK
jgi:hypothetical protein